MGCCRRDSSEDWEYENAFEDESTRRSFIMKVCTIVAFMLLATTAVMSIFVLNEDAKMWLIEHWWLIIPAIVVQFTILFMACCCPFLFRKVPLNYILLVLFVAAQSIIVSFVTMRYLPIQIIAAIGYTTLLVVALALFARFAPCDFTGCGPILLVLVLVLLVMGIVMFFYRTYWMLILFCCLGILVFSLFLVVDIQMIVGGKRRNQYSEEDYVLAAICIYIDIINLFLYILELIGLLD